VTKTWWLSVIVSLGLVWYVYNRHFEPGSEPTAEIKVLPEIKPVGRSAPEATAAATAEPEKSKPQLEPKIVVRQFTEQKGPIPKPPPRDTLQFELKEDGLAVAYGDVVLGKVQGDMSAKTGYTGVQKTRLWPTNVIPYSIDQRVLNQTAILDAIAYYNQFTSVRFVPRTDEPDSLVFFPAQELCASYLGRSGGHQPVYISKDCGKHEVLHELMHALGFVHEHARADRDRYVEIVWDNIDPQYWLQFWMVPDEWVHEYSGSVFDFDPESIMLYEPTAFAKTPGLVTIKHRNMKELKPKRGELSRVDIERLFYLYGE